MHDIHVSENLLALPSICYLINFNFYTMNNILMMKCVPVASLENPVLKHVVEHVLLQIFKYSFYWGQSNNYISPNHQVNVDAVTFRGVRIAHFNLATPWKCDR